MSNMERTVSSDRPDRSLLRCVRSLRSGMCGLWKWQGFDQRQSTKDLNAHVQSSSRLRVHINEAMIICGPNPTTNWHDLEAIMAKKENLVQLLQSIMVATDPPDVDVGGATFFTGAFTLIARYIDRWVKADLH